MELSFNTLPTKYFESVQRIKGFMKSSEYFHLASKVLGKGHLRHSCRRAQSQNRKVLSLT